MEALSRNRGRLLAVGILMIILGVIAIGAPVVATIAVQPFSATAVATNWFRLTPILSRQILRRVPDRLGKTNGHVLLINNLRTGPQNFSA